MGVISDTSYIIHFLIKKYETASRNVLKREVLFKKKTKLHFAATCMYACTLKNKSDVQS